jgi:hypothetical protein
MNNVVLLSYDGKCNINFDEEPDFKIIVNTWNKNLPRFTHKNEAIFYSETERFGEVMWIQSKVLRDLGIEYDYVISMNHDLKINVSSINKLFRVAKNNELDCFSPAMTQKNVNHHMFVSKKTKGMRRQPWIEMMMIGFSKRLYDRVLPHLDLLYGELNLVSGWGIDRDLIGGIIKRNKLKCFTIDSITMTHLKSTTSGKITWRNGITSKEAMKYIKTYAELLSKNQKGKIENLCKNVKDKVDTSSVPQYNIIE